MSFWKTLDNLEKTFVIWAFIFQIVLIIHFAIRKPLFESYTQKYGWIVYALCIPAVVISAILIRGGKDWTFWVGGFILLVYALFGFWVDYLAGINFRNPFQPLVGIPYVILYLATVMFYWWPLWSISRLLWGVYAVLYVVAMVLNIRSH